MGELHKKAWEDTAQSKYPDLTKSEAIKAYKDEMRQRALGGPGNKTAKLSPERARELQRLGVEAKLAKKK